MNKQPFVSVVIPTYNRRELLVECLDSLFNQSYPKGRYEIIVVNDGSTDGTEEMLSECEGKTLCGFKWFSQRNQGCSVARDFGVKKSVGSILCFTDDDCIADEKWIENLVEAYSNENIGGVGGRIIPYKPRTLVERYAEKNQFFNQELHKFYFITANASYRKKVLREIGGFDAYMFHCDDLDISIRTQIAGYKLEYCSNAIVYHKHRPSIEGLIKQMFGYGISYSRLHRKYPGSFILSHRIAYMCTRLLRKSIIIPFKSSTGIFSGDRLLRITEPFLDALLIGANLFDILHDTLFGERYMGEPIREKLDFIDY